MEKKMLNNDFILSIAEQEAWDKLSSELHWSETMLEKFKDNVNWEEISSNSEIFWTISMLKKFSYRIDWNELSRMICNESLSEECITTFADKWNWSELSRNSNLKLTHQLLEKFRENWDWCKIIDRWRDELFENKGIDFYERYKENIPESVLKNSRLWDDMVFQYKNQIIAEITA